MKITSAGFSLQNTLLNAVTCRLILISNCWGGGSFILHKAALGVRLEFPRGIAQAAAYLMHHPVEDMS